MKKHGNGRRVLAVLLAVASLALLTACSGGGSSDYETYATAYNRVTANAGIDADLEAVVTMDGITKNAGGNFKVDNSGDNTILYLEISMDEQTITQFSDGEYLYTDARGEKTKYALGVKPERTQGEGDEGQGDSGPEWDTESFISEFASFLEAGKIQELGLLSPIPQNAVSSTTKDGNVYHLTINDSTLNTYLKTFGSSVTLSGDDTVQITGIKDFTYDATVENDYVTQVVYTGTLTVEVPGSLTSDGQDGTYDLDLQITAKFNNPGSAVSVSIPSTDGYVEIS